MARQPGLGSQAARQPMNESRGRSRDNYVAHEYIRAAATKARCQDPSGSQPRVLPEPRLAHIVDILLMVMLVY